MIPPKLASQANVSGGSEVDVRFAAGENIVRSISRPKKSLSEMLARVTDENRHTEMDWGSPVDAICGDYRLLRHRQPAKRAKGMASPVATGTVTATSTSSSRWGGAVNGDKYVTSTITFSFKTPGTKTIG